MTTNKAMVIVRALAKQCPTRSTYSSFCDEPAEYDGELCFFCDADVFDNSVNTEKHEPDCLFRMACELVAAEGQS